jgi:hypothetical protein
LNGNVWINYADCLVCKTISGLSKQLIDRNFHFNSDYGGFKWVGDYLGNLSCEKYENYLLDLVGFIPDKKPSYQL